MKFSIGQAQAASRHSKNKTMWRNKVYLHPDDSSFGTSIPSIPQPAQTSRCVRLFRVRSHTHKHKHQRRELVESAGSCDLYTTCFPAGRPSLHPLGWSRAWDHCIIVLVSYFFLPSFRLLDIIILYFSSIQSGNYILTCINSSVSRYYVRTVDSLVLSSVVYLV